MAEPARHALLRRLAEGACTVGELSQSTGLEQTNTSHHLRQLRDCGFVAFEQDGKNRRYRLSHPAVATFLDTVDRTAVLVDALRNEEACQDAPPRNENTPPAESPA